jgi:hypothetical protein
MIFCALRCHLCYAKGEFMDWNGILGIFIALGVITLVFWGAQPLMDFLERFFERSKTQDDLEQVDQTLKVGNTRILVPAPGAAPGNRKSLSES